MLTISTGAELRTALTRMRYAASGVRVAFVPTMGALHAGHLSLVDAAREHGDVVVMSLFVNPLQFGPGEDLTRYPRDPFGDTAQAEAAGVDLLFMPDVAQLYPREPRVRVVPVPGAVAERWEGAVRPGHFAGVLTVVAKLLHLVQPEVAVFGQKDAQQVAVVRAMLTDLDWPTALVVAPTVREADGLALSSRNVYLDPTARARAAAIPRALHAAERAFADGEAQGPVLAALVERGLAREGGLHADYVAVADPDTLDPVERAEQGTLVLLAVRVGTTRLLDTITLGVPAFGTGLAFGANGADRRRAAAGASGVESR